MPRPAQHSGSTGSWPRCSSARSSRCRASRAIGPSSSLSTTSTISSGSHDRHHAAAALLVDDDVAGQQQADLELVRERPLRQVRVAGAENHVAAEVGVELLLQRRPDVDLGEDAEPLLLQGLGDALDRLRVGQVEPTSQSVTGGLGGHHRQVPRAGPSCGIGRRSPGARPESRWKPPAPPPPVEAATEEAPGDGGAHPSVHPRPPRRVGREPLRRGARPTPEGVVRGARKSVAWACSIAARGRRKETT